jgi:hypothetical protein
MRGGTNQCNIDTQTDEFADLAGLARKLGAPDA